jgi:hypothetical protein
MPRAASTQKRFGNAKILSSHDASGKRLPSQKEGEDSEGVAMDDVWDIGRVPPIKQLYPTQKPEPLLARIIEASSNIGANAESLTRALKGDNKAQGNWGEMIHRVSHGLGEHLAHIA